MKMMLSAFACLFGMSVFASDFSFEAGFRQQSGDSVVGTSTSSQVGYQLGGIGLFPISQNLFFRSGLFYTQRPLLVSTSGVESKYNMTYFDIPATLMYKFEDYGGAYAGIVAGMNLDHTCSGVGSCLVADSKSMITPFVFGASFRFAPQIGLNIFFESTGDVARDLKSFRAVGANFTFSVE